MTPKQRTLTETYDSIKFNSTGFTNIPSGTLTSLTVEYFFLFILWEIPTTSSDLVFSSSFGQRSTYVNTRWPSHSLQNKYLSCMSVILSVHRVTVGSRSDGITLLIRTYVRKIFKFSVYLEFKIYKNLKVFRYFIESKRL